MAEIEGFESIISSITLAKELYDINRIDVMEHFSDELSWDSYYENIWGVMSHIFAGYYGDYNEESEIDMMWFTDDVISNYFVHAWEYGKHHNLHFSQNPYVSKAQNEVTRWFNISCCVDWKLLSYIHTKKAAQKSKLFIYSYTGCGGCSSHEKIAYGLIQIYIWFKNMCDSFNTLMTAQNDTNGEVISNRLDRREMIAA